VFIRFPIEVAFDRGLGKKNISGVAGREPAMQNLFMVATASSAIPPGTPLPPFALKDVGEGREYRPETFDKASGLLVAFLNR